ncbi:MAG: hypothetical protein SPL62_08320 [Selenomonas sp.]|nr:hypothetical protein [Selenomonas sp.]
MKKSVFQKVMVAAMVGLGSLMIASSVDAKMQFYKPNKYRGRAVWWDKKLNHWNYHG